MGDGDVLLEGKHTPEGAHVVQHHGIAGMALRCVDEREGEKGMEKEGRKEEIERDSVKTTASGRSMGFFCRKRQRNARAFLLTSHLLRRWTRIVMWLCWRLRWGLKERERRKVGREET